MKTVTLLAIIALMLAFSALPFAVQAGGRHNEHETSETTVVSDITINQTLTQRITEEAKGNAISLAAAQHSFDMSTFAPQWSIGAASSGDSDAISFAIGKRFNNVLINGSIGYEDGEKGYGVGITGTF